jgi:uncharacterized surface protein with fasciclin (FAS1) repeats
MRLHSLRRTHVQGAAVAASIAFAVTACGNAPLPSATHTGGAGPVVSGSAGRSSSTGSPSPSGTSTSSPSTSSPSSPSPTAAATAALVGSDCGMIPLTGNGNIGSMSTKKAITAASSNPQLSVFVAAVRTADLDKTLNSLHSYTLIIPANSAFASLSRTQIIHLHKSGDLPKIIRYHAVRGWLSPQQFASGAQPATLQGKALKLSKTGPVYMVNGATVLCGNIKTSNATIYIVNKVLLPR